MTDGIVINDVPGVEWVDAQLRRVFRESGRLGVVSMEQEIAYWTVSTARYQRITAAELVRVAVLLNVDPARIEFEDSPPNAIRFVCDLAPVTRPEVPAAKRGDRP